MLTLMELDQYLNELLPSQGVTDYCPNGLQVEGKNKITKAATAVSVSLATIEAAVEMQADALIVHHGLFWQRDSYVIQGVKRKKIALLLEHGISLFAYHLPLDMHPRLGNNWRAAQELGWSDLQPFGYLNGVAIGVKGRTVECSREDFKRQLEKYYHHSAVCALGGKERIQTVALVSGGAYKNLTDASREGIDAFVTGSFDEPVWHQAYEDQINFFALGHSATERVGPIALCSFLQTELNLPCSFIDIENPF
jgi:dinuclear metal center YbgI/SA1388 family protein